MSDRVLDARGLICPLPVLKARKVLLTMPGQSSLRVLVTDAHAPKDFSLFCAEQGYILAAVEQTQDGFDVLIRK